MNSDLAVQDHHVLGVRGQPRLHDLAYGADFVQRRSMEVGPAKVVNLLLAEENDHVTGSEFKKG